ncbi:MAG: thymidine phosphorylase family protein [Deltaproteobacteria bacterium]|nr:thymidine phosphorylase family protein [Deltaproteobacteria bacterium]
MGIDTHQEAVVYLRSDALVCRAEGFQAQARVKIKLKEKFIIATLNILYDGLLDRGQAGLSEIAWERLGAQPGDEAEFSHAPTVESLSDLRAKVYGHPFSKAALSSMVGDIVAGRYADVHLASFITACADRSLNLDEITYLTEAMVESGESLTWSQSPIMDKHCVGGLPGNRTTPIVVAIVSAFGLVIPKTSSRAITSPAGTADTMEVFTKVDLSLSEMRQVVEKEGACLAWGGNMHLSPADDILIRVEKALDLDSEGQLIASVLSKKKAAGSTHVLMDIPTGPTAKVRSKERAQEIAALLEEVGRRIGLQVSSVITDGSQPVGRRIGPVLEALDVLAVLRQEKEAPKDLEERSLLLASKLLELSGKVAKGEGWKLAQEILTSGQAWKKFYAICKAQGGFTEPSLAEYSQKVCAQASGVLKSINNRQLARVAKLAGAPLDKKAGVELNFKLGDSVEKGQPLFTLYAESPGELNYALAYVRRHEQMFELEA